MQQFAGNFPPNPHDLSLHKQVKDIADLLRPELLRLHKQPDEISGNIQLYTAFIEQIRIVRKEVTNCDALFTFHNILNHMIKIIELAEKKAKNQEILWHLQEVMALLFKVQNLPS
ncbi:MAG: hypothetical protein JSS09_02845 [Verrucomicrobia bacterium]|nr:hypothetical protein [Verrucomicrobiota bacterium]